MPDAELTLDEIEQRLTALPQAERKAWLDHINRLFSYDKRVVTEYVYMR